MIRTNVISLLAAGVTLVASPCVQAEESSSGPTIVVTGKVPLTEEKALEVVRRVSQPVDGMVDEEPPPRPRQAYQQYESGDAHDD